MMNTAWHNTNIVPNEMVRGAKAEIPGWKRLEYSDHFQALDELVKSISEPKNILDIGCGAAEISRVYDIEYAGADLPHIIEDVAKVVNPNKTYIKFNADEDNLEFAKDYEVIIMNSFLSELNNPVEFMRKLINCTAGNIIIHRQDFTETKETFLENYNSYGGVPATNSVINYFELEELLKDNSFYIEKNISSGVDDKRSILIKRK